MTVYVVEHVYESTGDYGEVCCRRTYTTHVGLDAANEAIARSDADFGAFICRDNEAIQALTVAHAMGIS